MLLHFNAVKLTSFYSDGLVHEHILDQFYRDVQLTYATLHGHCDVDE